MIPQVAAPSAGAQSQVGATDAAPRAYLNRIGGAWVPAASGTTFENRSPARPSDLIGTFPKSDAGDVDRAVQAGAKAFETWRLVPAPRRAEILFRAA